MNTLKPLSWLLCALLLYPAAGIAQELTMADIKDPQKLTGNELRELLTGAKVHNKTGAGSTRRWENNADGKFIASSDAAGAKGAGRGRATTGAGSWHISPIDQYCVNIEWRTTAENWCVFIYKSGNKFYGARRQADPSARAVEFEFGK